jgi:hypothetical protein
MQRQPRVDRNNRSVAMIGLKPGVSLAMPISKFFTGLRRGGRFGNRRTGSAAQSSARNLFDDNGRPR